MESDSKSTDKVKCASSPPDTRTIPQSVRRAQPHRCQIQLWRTKHRGSSSFAVELALYDDFLFDLASYTDTYSIEPFDVIGLLQRSSASPPMLLPLPPLCFCGGPSAWLGLRIG